MRIKILLISIILLSISCKKENKEEQNNNYFLYENTNRYTPNAYYGIENDGIELTISSFIYSLSTGEYSGNGNGIDLVKIKSSGTNQLPIGHFQSFVNWGDTTSGFIGKVLIDVDSYSGNYTEKNIKTGNFTISRSSKGYLIQYTFIVEGDLTITGQYDGSVINN